jgi:hypothetical protein
MNPYVAAAKFVLSGRDLNKNVTQTASKIAADIAGRLGNRKSTRGSRKTRDMVVIATP